MSVSYAAHELCHLLMDWHQVTEMAAWLDRARPFRCYAVTSRIAVILMSP